MKIVQSFWSKPSLKASKKNIYNRNSGGWLDKKFNYMSWMLSCLLLNEFYSHIELVTDRYGYELLIKQMDLPYSHVKIELDNLNIYHNDLWALGKVYAYSIQNEPFIHVDGDVFIWDKFSSELESADLCVQSFEIDEEGYEEVYHYGCKNFSYMPEVLLKKHNKIITSINAGIIGGNNIPFFKEYTNMAFDLVNQNNFQGLNIGAFNMFYEQYLFYCLAKQKDLKINCLIDNQQKLIEKHSSFVGAPTNTNYIHTIGSLKKRRETGDLLEFTLKTNYPEYYYKLINLLSRNLI